jgi:hypothetical protein
VEGGAGRQAGGAEAVVREAATELEHRIRVACTGSSSPEEVVRLHVCFAWLSASVAST